jgi:thiamine-monophosphate kinase
MFAMHEPTAEHRLIASIQQWVGGKFIGDDCAVLPGGLVATSDTLVEGTHFDIALTSMQDLGWKSVAVNLSDVAAMGAQATYLLVNLTLPEGFAQGKVRALFEGMVDCARTFRSQIVGGDITRGPHLVITITALGDCHAGGCLRRSTALPGDVVVVSGDFGASAAGLWALRGRQKSFEHCKTKHLRPIPRLVESAMLIERTGSRAALMDASDGLGDALAQIAAQSQVGMRIEMDSVPIHVQTGKAAASAGVMPEDWALYGGEDYELVATLPREIWLPWKETAYNPFTEIGTVDSSGRIELRHPQKGLLPLDLSKSFQHLDGTD